jgi:CRP-like cAMP-binding protein
MNSAAYDLIKKSDWFSELPDEVIHLLLQRIKERDLKVGDALIEKGKTDDSVFLIQDGWVKIVIPDEAGDEMVLNHVGPREMVGELSLVDRRPRSASVIAISALKVLELTRDDFLYMMGEYPMMGLHMLITMSKRMRFVLTYVEQAVQWSHRIAEGDFSFLEENKPGEESNVVDHTATDETRANRFLAAFFAMAEGVKEREKQLQEQLIKLTIEIDKVKRDSEISQITESEFFNKLKSDTLHIREGRDKSKD